MLNIPEYWQTKVSPTKLTHMQVGGPLLYLAKVHTLSELQETIAISQSNQLPFRILGAGSNLILPDDGFEGVMIKLLFSQSNIVQDQSRYQNALSAWRDQGRLQDRYSATQATGFLQLNQTVQIPVETVTLVELGAGVAWGQAVTWSLGQNLAGLHWFARIPCNIGGALFNNIHGGKYFISQQVVLVQALNSQTGQLEEFSLPELDFSYDFSIFHRRPELIILKAIMALYQVTPELAAACREQYIAWTKEKIQVQPVGANCGSVFQNFSREQVGADQPLAAAWYIEQAGWKGRTLGGFQVYPLHANFITNLGQGKQAEFISLIHQIRQSVFEQFGLWLLPEAECMGVHGERLIWETGNPEPHWHD